MRRRSARGFTLTEMVVVIAISGGLTASILSILKAARRQTTEQAQYLHFSGDAMVMFRRVREDARAATHVSTTPGQLTLTVSDTTVLYAVNGDGVITRVADGQAPLVVARRVARFEPKRTGRRLDVSLSFQADTRGWVTAEHDTVVALADGVLP